MVDNLWMLRGSSYAGRTFLIWKANLDSNNNSKRRAWDKEVFLLVRRNYPSIRFDRVLSKQTTDC